MCPPSRDGDFREEATLRPSPISSSSMPLNKWHVKKPSVGGKQSVSDENY
jgi:hypothetical protein